jgi:hypothetical protein
MASMMLLAGTSAAAQEISNINSSAGSAYTTPALECVSGSCFDRHPLGDGAGRFPGQAVSSTAGASYNSFVDVGAGAITFESSNAVSQGAFTSFSSYSTVSFDFFNSTGGAVDFHSQITPQGMGMYLADTSGGCLFTNSCAQVSDELYTFGDLAQVAGATLGGVAFSFEILDNGASLYSLDGALLLQRNTDALYDFDFLDTLYTPMGESPADLLTGFRRQTDLLDLSARAYAWDATDVHFALGSGLHQLEYRTSVYSFTNTTCTGPYSTICLVAYSGFGDPIGRGGAIDALAAFDIGSFVHQGDDLIGGLNFQSQTFDLYYSDGRLTYAGAGGVPEPTTWALMIMGFGLLGAALRRRQIPAHIDRKSVV